MKVLAFFNIKEKSKENEFLDWAMKKQKKVFEREIKGLKDFNVYKITDYDGLSKIFDVVQILDWDGTAESWRKTLDSFKKTKNRKIIEIRDRWLSYCDDKSTAIIYAGN